MEGIHPPVSAPSLFLWPREKVLGTSLREIAKNHGYFNMADRMELEEENKESLPGIGDLKTFSQVITDQLSLGSVIQLSMVFISPCFVKPGDCN